MESNSERMDDRLETGVSEGDARGNSPDAPGFTDTDDRVFRSHFQHANRMADRAYEDVELEIAEGWMNVRTQTGDWGAVRDVGSEGVERGRRLGYVDDATPLGDAKRGQRPPYSDPVADNIDPTSPESPEQNP